MDIGIVGTGNIGSGLAKHWSRSGHRVMFGSRHPQEVAVEAASIGPDIRVGTVAEAAQFGEVVVLAVPWTAIPSVVKATGPLGGKTVIETTNPIGWGPDGAALAVGPSTSAAEEIAKQLPDAHVVKAFNTTYAAMLHAGPQFGSRQANVFYCGDDASAKAKTAQLAQDIGFEPIDIGPLRMARFLEPFTVILIQLQRLPGMSSDMGYGILRR